MTGPGRSAWPLLAVLVGCGGSKSESTSAPTTATSPEPALDRYRLVGGTVVGVGPAEVAVENGRIVALGEVDPSLPEVDVSGRWIAPGFVDSHVHLAYLPDAKGMADGGVVVAVDLAAPIETLAAPPSELELLSAGPMITAIGGYPTQSWGANGYGLEVADVDAAVAAVGQLADAGARVIKVPVTTAPVLDAAQLAAVVEAAHARDLLVAAHALGDADAAAAAEAGCDVLAHTPVEPLSDATVAQWADRAVISSLRAFGASSDAIDNLRRLREAGATVLYGTDFGNTRTAGIDGTELEHLAAAGLDGEAILAAGTATPADFWGLDDWGAVAEGKRVPLLVLDADPLLDPSTLSRPVDLAR